MIPRLWKVFERRNCRSVSFVSITPGKGVYLLSSKGFHFRPSYWPPISYLFRRFRKFCPVPWSTCNAELGEEVCSGGHEKPINGRRSNSASNIPRRGGFWFSRRTAHQRIKKSTWSIFRILYPDLIITSLAEPVPVHDSVPPVSGRAEKDSVPLKRSLVKWARVKGVVIVSVRESLTVFLVPCFPSRLFTECVIV